MRRCGAIWMSSPKLPALIATARRLRPRPSLRQQFVELELLNVHPVALASAPMAAVATAAPTTKEKRGLRLPRAGCAMAFSLQAAA
mmetsp:Transcript_46940/g.102062  ORF Transcript_46940/g.102062 Transcript_46940/m.102062 type:complete len:86 (+) Transcript_46940:910-1167(+)